MVAVSSMISFTDESAEGLHPAVFLIFFDQERHVKDEAVVHPVVDVLADEDVVEASPSALVFVGATCAVPAFGVA